MCAYIQETPEVMENSTERTLRFVRKRIKKGPPRSLFVRIRKKFPFSPASPGN